MIMNLRQSSVKKTNLLDFILGDKTSSYGEKRRQMKAQKVENSLLTKASFWGKREGI